jgi:protoporphyrinogen/coproporphyrinogen III oxidase
MQVDAGVVDRLVMGDPTAPRFVYWENKLRATPSGPLSAVFGDFLSFPGKIRAGLGAIGLFKAPPPPNKEESVKEFISRNLGPEVFYRLIEPFCSGVYAGNPENLSMKGAFGRIQVLEEKGGSLVGGALELMKERKANPPPPRDQKLPPKPAGQTVASFQEGELLYNFSTANIAACLANAACLHTHVQSWSSAPGPIQFKVSNS